MTAINHTMFDQPFLLATTIPAPVTPPSFPGLQAWWKSDSYVGVANGTSIGGAGLEWIDQAGSFDGTQSGADAQFKPIYRTNIYGTMPAIEFQVSLPDPQFYLVIGPTENGGVNLPGDFTILFIGQAATLGASNTFGGSILGNAYTINDSAIEWGTQFAIPNAARITGATVAQASSSYAGSGPFLISYIRSGTNLEFRKNNNSVSTHTLGAVDTFRLNHMCATNFNTGGVGVRFAGYIGELCIYNTALAAANCDALFTQYFKTRFSLT